MMNMSSVNIAEAAAAAQRVAAAYQAAKASGAVPDENDPSAPVTFTVQKTKSTAFNPVAVNPSAMILYGGGFYKPPEESVEEGVVQRTIISKWGPDPMSDPLVKKGRALALQTRIEQITTQLEQGLLDLDENEATRSPSPPPLYDNIGQRLNTREQRKRDQLDAEKREAIAECAVLDPHYKPPAGFKPVLKEARLPIPNTPGYNFIGLILGPRGNTQKRMEQETGARIVIRGKGATKEGKKDKYMEGANEELHVHISADKLEKVDAALALIEPLLTPIDENRNVHKRKQLHELALMNGTVKDLGVVCTLCGEMGHRDWQCPKDKIQTFNAKVLCAICGDGGHPTVDCPLKHSGTHQGPIMEKEYASFLEEINAGVAPPGSNPPPPRPIASIPRSGPMPGVFPRPFSSPAPPPPPPAPSSDVPPPGMNGPPGTAEGPPSPAPLPPPGASFQFRPPFPPSGPPPPGYQQRPPQFGPPPPYSSGPPGQQPPPRGPPYGPPPPYSGGGGPPPYPQRPGGPTPYPPQPYPGGGPPRPPPWASAGPPPPGGPAPPPWQQPPRLGGPPPPGGAPPPPYQQQYRGPPPPQYGGPPPQGFQHPPPQYRPPGGPPPQQQQWGNPGGGWPPAQPPPPPPPPSQPPPPTGAPPPPPTDNAEAEYEKLMASIGVI